jgi:hypothetical protein
VCCVVNFFSRRWVRRLVLLLGHLFLGLQGYWTISCPVIHISFVIYVVRWSVLASPSACVTTSRVVIVFSRVECSASVFWLRWPEVFLLFFQCSASIRVNTMELLGCIIKSHCALSAPVILGGSGGFILLRNISLLLKFAEV